MKVFQLKLRLIEFLYLTGTSNAIPFHILYFHLEQKPRLNHSSTKISVIVLKILSQNSALSANCHQLQHL